MRQEIDPYWLQLNLIGFDEDPEDDPDEESENDPDEESENGDGSQERDTDSLKKALRAERRLRRQAERDRNALKKTVNDRDSQEKQTTEEAQEQARVEQAKATRLAERLRKSEEDNVITRIAIRMNFVDIDDALKLLDRGDIDIEQSDDDPSSISVDEMSVEDALKELAQKKPHLLTKGDDGSEDDGSDSLGPSGSKFGGKRKKVRDELDEATLKELYPSLR